MIARERASYTRTPIGSRAPDENSQQLHDPVSGVPAEGATVRAGLGFILGSGVVLRIGFPVGMAVPITIRINSENESPEAGFAPVVRVTFGFPGCLHLQQVLLVFDGGGVAANYVNVGHGKPQDRTSPQPHFS
jgi:hypothetical protein